MLLLPLIHYGQINQSYNWDSGLEGWVSSGSTTMNSTTYGCSSGAVRTNIYFDFYDYISYETNNFRSPLLSGSNGDLVTVNLKYRAVNYNYSAPTAAAASGSFEVQMQWSSTASGPWTNFGTLTTPALGCTDFTGTFTPGTGDVYIRFVSNLLDDDEDLQIYFDDLTILQGPPPTCITPTNVVITTVTPNSAIINWTASTSLPANGYMYEVRTDTNPGVAGAALVASGTTVAGITTANPNTLSANTQYNVYVRANCGSGDLSGWSAISTFRTLCLPSNVPYLENFDSYAVGAFPQCWTRPVLYSGYPSVVASNSSSGPNSLRFQSLTTAPTYAITPAFSPNIETLRVKFKLKREGTNSGQIEVGVMTDPTDLNSFVLIQSINPTDNDSHEYVIPFNTSTVTGANRYIAFKHVSAASNYYYWLDDVVVEELPLCSDVVGLTTSNTTKNTTRISWNGITPEPANGYSYEIRTSGLPGTPGAIQSGTVASGVHFKDLINLVPLTDYIVYVRSLCGSTQIGNWSAPFVFKTLCNHPDLVLATPAARCGEGTVDLSASFDSGVLNWYTSQTGGSVLGSGNTFTTPVINTTTSFWVDSSLIGATEIGGKAVPGGVSYTSASTYGLIFDANSGFKIETVDVYLASNNAGSIVVNLTNNLGTVIDSRTIAVPAGNAISPVLHTLNLDMNVPVGTGYRLLATSSLSLVRDSSGNTYPYALGSLGSITGGYLSGVSSSYYFFYNWSIKSNCSSLRTEVVATVTPAPVLTLSDNQLEICANTSALLSVTAGASDYDSFVWSPATGVTGNQTTGWTFNPTQTTVYTLTASQTSGSLCVTTKELNVVVNPLPVFTALNATYDFCANVAQELNTNLVTTSQVVVGTGTNESLSTDKETAFENYYGEAKKQFIYTKQELNDLGITSGTISGIAFNVSSLGTSATNNNYTIKIKTVAQSNFANSTFLTGGFTTVYGPVTHTHTASGWQQIDFSTPFVWDGDSNLLVEIFNEGAGTGSNAKTQFTVTSDNKSLYTRSDTAGESLNATTGTLSANRLNARFVFQDLATATWSPQTNLYMDQAATQPYTGGHATKVYVKSSQSGNTVYTVNMVSIEGCVQDATTSVNITTVSDPVIANQTFCDETEVSDIIVTGLTTGATLKWFDSINSTTEITSIATSGTYYVVQELNGCSSSRVSVDININGVNVAPVTNATQAFCGVYTVADLVATPLTGNTIGWFDSATSNTPLATSATLVSGTYYVAQFNGNCWSPKVEVAVTVGAVPTAPTSVNQIFCGVHTLAEVDLGQASNAILNWYTSATSASVLPLTTQIITTTYFVSQTIDGCESSRVAVPMTVQAVLSAPAAPATQLYCGITTIANLDATADVGGTIGWFDSSTSNTPLASTLNVVTGTYYVAQYNGACWSPMTTIQVTVGSVPVTPNNAPLQLCGSYTLGQISLGQPNNATLNWYATQTSMPVLPLSTNAITGTYYVSQTIGGCESARVMINVTSTAALGLPTTIAQTFCTSATVADLVVQGVPGATINWYNAANALNPLAPSTVLVTGTYYAEQAMNGCTSARIGIAVQITSSAAPTVNPFNFCGSGLVSDLVIPAPTGTTYKWYNSPSNPTELNPNTALATGTYYVSRVQSGCESARASVDVTIHSIPNAPTGITPQTFIEGSTINDIVMNQSNVTWYISAEDAANGVNPLVQGMPLVNGTTYYGVIIGTNNCPSLPFVLTVDVYLSDKGFVKNELKYYPNPVEDIFNITYSERILQIEVFDLLGKRVKVKSTDDKEVNIDLSDLASGTYMIQLKTESKQQFIKVVKK